VIGGMVLVDIFKQYSKRMAKMGIPQLMKVLSIFLFVFLLFNSGWVYELAKDNPTSIALSNVDYPRFSEKEVVGASWLHNTRTKGGIYADSYRWLLLIGFEGYPYDWLEHYNVQSPTGLYVFLGGFNIRNNVVLEVYEIGPRISLVEYVEVTDIIRDMSKIYDNGGANVYLRVEH